jgi:threonine dehydrogenase-like Zn-dependent dehydrogenase
MRGAVLYGPRDVRVEERDIPKIINPTDAIIRISAACVCGSDLWPYRGIQPVTQPTPMGHEYCGIVEEVGSEVKSVKPGQFVIGSFFASDNTCPTCQIGYQSSCQHRELVGGAQAPLLRVPLADGTLVATPNIPSEDLIPSLLTLSDVMGTGWFAADAANVKPGSTVAVVGDGAVGLLGILSAKQMGAARIIAMSRHESRQKLALEFGATEIVTERGEKGVGRIKELTNGIGADSVLECVGTRESMMQAISSTRPGGYIGYVGVPHGVELDGEQLFFAHVHLHGGPAPVRRYLPKLIELVWNRKINPGKVFDLTLHRDTVRWTSAVRSNRCFIRTQRDGSSGGFGRRSEQWKSRELVRRLPAKVQLSISPARCVLIRCLRRMLRLAPSAQVSPSSRELGQRGTRIRLAKRSS